MRTKTKTNKSFAPMATGLGGAVIMSQPLTKMRAAMIRAITALLLTVMLTATVQTARAQDTKQDGTWTYKDYGTYALVSAYTGSDKTTLTTLNFPMRLGGKVVMGLAHGFQFKDFSNLQTLNFYTNALIDEMPFVTDCSKLAHINTINTNGTTAKADCLPGKMKKIPGNCFRGTAITTIDLYKVTSVGSQVFKDCNSLQNVYVNKEATIEVHAFSYIPGSCRIDYNSWVTDWTWEMIAYSPNLYVYCTSGVIGWCGDGNNSAQDLLYWTMDTSRKLTIACAGDGWFNFQDKQIIKSHRWNDWAAENNKPIVSITLQQVYALGDNEFKGMTGVKSVTLNDGLTSIGASAFEGCTALTTITIPASVTSIGADAFKGCTALTTVTIEGNPTIAAGAFPNGVTVNLPPATAPTITTQPTDLNLTEGYESGNVLTVAASTVEGQTLSYQWYSNTTKSTTGGTAIDDATKANYTVPTEKTAGTYYYYCLVTATMSPNGQTANATSDVATVTIASAEPPAPTAYALSGEYVSFYPEEGYDNITKANAGQTVTVSVNRDDIPTGKYFTGTYSSDDVNVTVDEVGDGTFTMPAKAVTVNAVLGDQEEYTLDVSTTTPQIIPESVYLLMNSQVGYFGGNMEGNMWLDINLDGTNDLQLTESDGSYTVTRLPGADGLTKNYRFTYPMPYRYNSLLVKLGNDYEVQQQIRIDEELTDSDPYDSNNSLIAMHAESQDEGPINVLISGRTLYKDGDWNTICLPFPLASLTGTPLEGASVKTLASTDYNSTTRTLTLNFTTASAIEAGRPYIVKWAQGTHIVNPIFSGVTLVEGLNPVATTYADFTGSYAPVSLTANDKTVLYLGPGNKLYYPSADKTMGAFRGYFRLKGITADNLSSPAHARRFVLNFDDEDQATGIISLKAGSGQSAQGASAADWFMLDGRRLSTAPKTKGIYIHQGKKTIIK